MTDTERLEWYVRHLEGAEEALASRIQVDEVIKITAVGEPTVHERWYWPLDGSNREFISFRDAIDDAMTNAHTPVGPEAA